MKNLYKRLSEDELINTSLQTGIATIIYNISRLILSKIIALTLGPAGIAIISQYENFVNLSTTLAAGGFQQGIVKYLAENRTDLEYRGLILTNALRLTVLLSGAISLSIFLFSNQITDYLFHNKDYRFIVTIFGFTVSCFGLNNLLISILNGIGDINKLATIKISTSIFGLLITAIGTWFYGIIGALLAISLSQAIILFITIFFVARTSWFKVGIFGDKIDRGLLIKLLKFSLMTISTMVLYPVFQIQIRNFISLNLSSEDAGYWDGVSKISAAYLGIITTTLSYYYLPKLSSLSEKLAIRNEIIRGLKIISPVMILAIVIIYLFKDYIIIILFSKDFLKISTLVFPQLVGDFFKIISWLFSFLMLAKAKTTLFIVSQTIFYIVNYLLSILLINTNGLIGSIYAYAIVYFIYAIAMIYLFRGYLIKNNNIELKL